ncbi:ring canal kelch homolog [Acyrthosiphon pisum]|uniref:Kelch-like protein diablo n=1 Tax=Acyrthosiphon pisum TaxID=7029 RepID=A0A8R2H626_ACYPI|nr:ring canal kelch homolog [Acyrthosiphon pisum]|eukprot:XP_016657237.1 PREDICTED: ring canal kelch homolog [Acyrthosiphon pisum]
MFKMQSIQEISISSSSGPARYKYKKSSYVEIFEALQSLRNNEVLCDIELETDDSTKILGHKVVLASASPYFHAMFTNFSERNHDHVVIRQLDSTALQLLVNFIYSGEIVITEKNVQILLPAANLLQLQEIKDICCDFLQKQLHYTNCLGINTLADLHSCTKLLTSSELYIQQNFSKVVEADEFLTLSPDQVVKLISSDELAVPSEEKVFECVIRWVKHELVSRKCILPQLMEHVRLPLTSSNYIFKNVFKEPLLNNCLCKDYIIEALHFLKSDQLVTVPECIRIKPRQPSVLHKVILVIGGHGNSTECYNSKINQWNFGPEMITTRFHAGLAVLKDNCVFAVGGIRLNSTFKSVEVLNLSSETPCWKLSVDMLVERSALGVGIINNYLYAVGGCDGTNTLNSVEVFDCISQEWRMVSNMSTRRSHVGVGVLNDLLYAVGGNSSGRTLNSVECYHPSFDKWIPVAEMCFHRCAAGVGVLDGVLYAVGGCYRLEALKSVEAYRPSTGVWITIVDMNFPRENAGVVALDGLLYAIGGRNGLSCLKSVEVYNPITNTWTMLRESMKVERSCPRVVTIGHRPPHF